MSSETFSLQLRYRQGKPHPAEAWLVPGNSAEAWMGELQRWQVPLDEARLLAIPGSAQSRHPGGALVLGITPRCAPGPQVIGYRRVGSKLYLPCDADIHPIISDVEIDDLTPFALGIWRPAIGLIGFDTEDWLRVIDLITRPVERTSNFSWAHPGLPHEKRLYAITPAGETSIHVLLSGGARDIGSADARDLPETPEEQSSSAVKDWRTQVKLRFLSALQQLANKAEATARAPTWINRLEEWTEERINALQDHHERELKRLLHLLKTDPDQGLKYALPLFSDQHRGTAVPSSRLTKREPDFNLKNLGGGHAASPWVVDWQKHYELSQQYRDAASRELRLGRHRRAAYIYAELLKDYREAANVLRQGKCYREAATLYLKNLGDRLKAAQCLREGGFLSEAIAIYEQKKQYETVGELYRELGNEEECRRAYKLAVSQCLAHGQSIRAATLLEQALDEPEQAIEILQKAWPRSNDAALCLDHELGIYQRMGKSERACRRLEIVTNDHPAPRAVDLLDVLVRNAQHAPDRPVREVSERCGFMVAGRWLGSPNFQGTQAMLGKIRQLAPGDRLLVRDTARFQKQLVEEETRRLAKTNHSSKTAEPVVLAESYSLPSWASWFAIEPRGRTGFYALGSSPQGTSLLRCDWQGLYQTQMLPQALPARYESRVRLAVAHETLPEVVSVMGWDNLPEAIIPPCDAFPSETRVENPPWCHDRRFLGMAYAASGVAWVIQREKNDSDLILSSYSSMGDLIATHTLRPPVESTNPSVGGPIPMICTQEQIVWVYQEHLMRFYRDQLEVLPLENQPDTLCYSQRGQLRIVVPGAFGAEIFWADASWGRRRTLALELRHPKATFTLTGDMLVLSSGRLDLLVSDRGQYQPRLTVPLPDNEVPLGIFATETPNFYALVTQARVQTLRFDPRRR